MGVDGRANIVEIGKQLDVHGRLAGQSAIALQDVFIVVDQQDILRFKLAVFALGHQRRRHQNAVFIHANGKVAARSVGQTAVPHVLGCHAHFLAHFHI